MNTSTRYIQRVRKPTGSHSPFCFGGGGGQISDEGWKLLDQIFEFDYMGAAEFENGSVPRAINTIASAEDRTIEKIFIPMAAVNNDMRAFKSFKGAKKDDTAREVYVVAPKSWLPEITVRLVKLAEKEKDFRLKCFSGFSSALDPVGESDRLTVGWLELDNGFFFTTDKEMAIKFAAMIEVPAG